MCRVFGCVAAEPASIRHELVEAENPLIRQSEEHDSGWGMAVYERADGLDPSSSASPRPPTATASSSRPPRCAGASSTSTCGARRWAASRPRTRIRSASASYSFGHNGTILRYPRLLEDPGVARPQRRHRLRGVLQLPDDDLRRRPTRSSRCAGRSAPPSSARPSAASTSSSRTAIGCLPTGSGCSSCTGCAGPGSCWWPPSASPTRSGTPSSRTCCSCSIPTTSRSPHAERLVGDELVERRAIRGSTRRRTCAARRAAPPPPSARARQWRTS